VNQEINNEDINEQTLHAIEGQEMYGYACVNFGCTHQLLGFLKSLPIYLLGKKNSYDKFLR